jgi:uncharacterized protein YkwD
MKQRQIFTGVLLGVLVVASNMTPASAQAAQADAIVQLVNALRASRGLPAYRVDGTLTAVAQAQAEWSAANNHFGHDGPGGSTPRDRAIAGGYGGGKSISAQENIANGTLPYITPDWVVGLWQGDDIHLGAMLSTNHDDIGVGYAEAGNHAWYVMMIGRVGTGSIAQSQPQPTHKSPASTSVPVTVAPPVQLSTPEPDGSIHHVMQAGQTAWTVAAYYGIDLAELLRLNNLTENSVLQPGDVLIIRPPTPLTALPSTPSPMPAAIAAVPTTTQIPVPEEAVETEAPTAPMTVSRSIPDERAPLIWSLLALAIIVFVGSVGRAIYIIRKGRTEQESSDE